MTRRSPRSTLFPYTNALPISHEGKDFTAIPGTAESSVLVVGESTWLIGQFESEDQDLEKEIYDLHYSNVAGSANYGFWALVGYSDKGGGDQRGALAMRVEPWGERGEPPYRISELRWGDNV